MITEKVWNPVGQNVGQMMSDKMSDKGIHNRQVKKSVRRL